MVSGSKSGSNFNSPEFDLRHFNSQFSQNHTIVVDLLVTYSIFLIFPFSHSGTIFYKTILPCKTLSYQKHFLSSGVYFLQLTFSISSSQLLGLFCLVLIDSIVDTTWVFPCVYECMYCGGVQPAHICRDQKKISLCLIPLRQALSLNLKLGWLPTSYRVPLVSTSHSAVI